MRDLTDVKFLVLTDSTFQHLLTGCQYGVRTVLGGQAVICPGATLTKGCSGGKGAGPTPSISELLVWHCRQLRGHEPAYSSEALLELLENHLQKQVSVALIPVANSVPVEKQVNYDWIEGARSEYGLQRFTLHDQSIMSTEDVLKEDIDSNKKLHFRPPVAGRAIQAITARALEHMVEAHPERLPIIIMASWNSLQTSIRKEMLFTKELCEASTLEKVCEIAMRYCAVPWGLRNTFGPRTEDEPFPAKMFQTFYRDATAAEQIEQSLASSRCFSLHQTLPARRTLCCHQVCLSGQLSYTAAVDSQRVGHRPRKTAGGTGAPPGSCQ